MMEGYVFKRNKEGIHYINLAKTWEKIMVAARIIAAVQLKNAKDVLVSIENPQSLMVLNDHFQNFQVERDILIFTFFLDCLKQTICPKSCP